MLGALIKKRLLIVVIVFSIIFYVEFFYDSGSNSLIKRCDDRHTKLRDKHLRIQKPYIFIGGSGRSGTTLMRAIIDVHDDVFCGVETGILPFVLGTVDDYMNLEKDPNTYQDNSTIEMAVSLFVQYMVEARTTTKLVRRPCAKDPHTLLYMQYMHNLFPNAQFVYMVRNVRSVCYSTLAMAYSKGFNGNLTSIGVNKTDIKECVDEWDEHNSIMYQDCMRIGNRYCLMTKYEDLVHHPERVIRRVVRFLGLSWTDGFLNHAQYVNVKIELGHSNWTRNVKKRVNTESLVLWKGRIIYNETHIAGLKMAKLFKYV